MTAAVDLSRTEIAEFRDQFDVSRETVERLRLFAGLLRHWNRRINLVAASTVKDVWRRHIVDSAQLYPLLKDHPGRLVDLGSGAGLPGLVLAVMGIAPVTLVESNNKKCSFLAEAARITGTVADIRACRIESLAPLPGTGAVTARALAPLDKLLGFASRAGGGSLPCYFLKGAHIEEELTECTKSWTLRYDILPSLTDERGVVLRIMEFEKKHE